LKQHPDWEKNADERKEMESLNLDLAYIQHFPKTEKYISLYPNENADDPVVSKARSEIREKIRIALEKQEIFQLEKTKREEVKAKILSHEPSTEEAIKLTTQKISNSKKRTIQDEHDPLAARARATAVREASKPVQASTTEEETFFEMIPKVVAASELNKAKEPAKKKTKKESQPEKQAPSTAQQTKEQPKESEQKQATENTEGEKKLGKWAKKAIRNQQAAAAETQQSESDSDSGSSSAESPSSEDEGTRQRPATKKGSANKTKPAEKNPAAEKQDQPAGKKVEKKTGVKAGKAEVKKEKQEAQTKNGQKAEVKTDAPKITTLKVNHDDTSDSDSSDESDDEPVAPVRKIVKIDETLLKELPEVPKRRGGRNQHKYRK